jgi:hypothetical protein
VEDVEAVVFAGALPVFAGGAEAGAEGFVEGLAGAGAGVAVDAAEITRDAADEGGFENAAVTLVLKLFQDGVGVAVDGMRIARAADRDFVAAVEREAVGFADEFAAVKHPDGDGVLQELALLAKGEAEVWMIFAFERHGARDGIAEAEGDEHAASSVSGLEREFLNAPVENFGDVEFVFAGAGDGVDPAELAGLLAGFAEHTEKFPVERKFVDAAGEGVGSVENLIRAGRDAEGPRRAGGHGAGGGGGFVADGGAGIGGSGDVDGDLAEKFSFAIENLDAAIAAVGDVDIILCVDGNAVRGVELAGLVTGFAKGF